MSAPSVAVQALSVKQVTTPCTVQKYGNSVHYSLHKYTVIRATRKWRNELSELQVIPVYEKGYIIHLIAVSNRRANRTPMQYVVVLQRVVG